MKLSVHQWIIGFILVGSYASSAQVFDTLVWSDEFSVNGSLDSAKWWHQTQLPNGTSWWNGEIQHYTNRDTNSYCDNGYMYLTARAETFTDQGLTTNHTSARLNSKFAFTYGRVEVKAQLPTGVGTWPAIWMLGQNITENGAYWQVQGYGTTGWPHCGEIDIMEHWGTNQDHVSSAIHTPSSFGGTVNVGGQMVTGASTGFHVYAVEWSPTKMVFSVDSVVHYTYEPSTYDSNTWPFDDPQFLLLNIAILPNIDTGFVSSPMIVDYVRVYQSSTISQEELELQSIEVFPNPVHDALKIRQPYEAGTLQLFDAEGKQVMMANLNFGSNEIDISHLPSGSYVARVHGKTSQAYAEHVVIKSSHR